jgi:hypothetical protein
MARALPDGTVLDPDGFVVFSNEPSGETLFPKVAWNGDTYGVIWYDNYLPQGQQPLQYAMVRPDGTLAVSAQSVPNSLSVGVYGFEIGSNEEEFLISWQGDGAVRASRIAADGTFLGTKIVQTTGNWIVDTPTVAFNGQSYLIAWEQGGEDGYTIFARLVAQDGTPLGSTFTIDGPFCGSAVEDILIVGADFVVTYIHRFGGALSDFEFLSARIDASGAIIEGPTPFLADRLTELYAGTSLAVTPGGTMFGTVSLWAGNPYNGPRAHGFTVDFGSSCYPDFTGDGALDLFDFLAYVNAFSAGDLEADCEANGGLDLFDFLCFVNAFNEGSKTGLLESQVRPTPAMTVRLGPGALFSMFCRSASAQSVASWISSPSSSMPSPMFSTPSSFEMTTTRNTTPIRTIAPINSGQIFLFMIPSPDARQFALAVRP